MSSTVTEPEPAEDIALTYRHPDHRPMVREHVFYVEEGKMVIDALVDIVFSENGMPSLTLVIVRPGGNGTFHKIAIPHRDHRNGHHAYWIFPCERIDERVR